SDAAGRQGTRADRARGRIFHREEALSERRFLLGHHPRGDRLPDLDVHADLRAGPHRRLDLAVEGDARGSEPAHRPSAPALYRRDAARLRGYRESLRRTRRAPYPSRSFIDAARAPTLGRM